MLTYLGEVARSGSLRKAASRLNVALSAVNRQILALEEELSTPVFERLRKRLRCGGATIATMGTPAAYILPWVIRA